MAYGGYSSNSDDDRYGYGYNDYDDDDPYESDQADYRDDLHYDDYHDDSGDQQTDDDGYGDQWYDQPTLTTVDEHVHTRPRSQYEQEIPSAKIRAIIQDEMVKQNLQERDLPNSCIIDNVKGFAWFSCMHIKRRGQNKPKRWPSAHAWCSIDLKKKEICDRIEQGCNVCNTEVLPEFTEEAVRRMAAYAVRRFLIRTKRIKVDYTPSTETDQTEGGPHDESRCGKCRRLGRSCWKRSHT